MKGHRLFLVLLIVLQSRALIADSDAADSDTFEEHFVDGLVQRRLFSLAELACSNRLADEALSDRQRAEWAVELIRIHGEHATHSLPASRGAEWQAAHKVARDFLARHADNPRAILIELQDALTYLAEGELARMEARIAADSRQAFERARDTIRTATRQLETIDEKLSERMSEVDRGAHESGGLTADELFSLQNNVRFQLARAYRNQGLCYPSGSNDRTAALSLAIKQLNSTLTQLREEDALTWQVYLDLAVCNRLLGELSEARRVLEVPLAHAAPAKIRVQAIAELVRIMIAGQQAREALQELDRIRAELDSAPPDLDFARLEAMLSLWKRAAASGEDELAERWREKVAGTVAAIEQTHGGYWGRRAKLEQLRVAEKGMASEDVNILVNGADELYRKEQFDEAIGTYEKAAELAREAGDVRTAVDAELKAALIEQQLKRHDAASRRFQRVALEDASAAQASSKHLLAIWNAAQTVGGNPQAVDRYRTLLTEHLTHWPSGKTADKARKWLGDLYRSQTDWKAAVETYRNITPNSELYPEAINALARCWEQWLDQRQRRGGAVDAILADALEFFDAVILGPERRWPERWAPAQLNAALITARLRLRYSSNALADTQRVLQAAMKHAPADDDQWLQEAQSLLVAALAGQAGHEEDALQLLAKLDAKSANTLLQLAELLDSLAQNTSPPVQSQMSRVQLEVLDELEASSAQLNQTQQPRLEQIRAGALMATGKKQKALELYQRLASEQPDNGAIQMKYGDVLLQAEDSESLSEAVVQWQKISRRTRPGTDDWLRARYCIALALYKRNRPATEGQPADREVAAKRLRYLKATSNVDKTSWKTKVDELLRRCTRQSNGEARRRTLMWPGTLPPVNHMLVRRQLPPRGEAGMRFANESGERSKGT